MTAHVRLAIASDAGRLTVMNVQIIAWLIVIFGYILPLGHVALSPRGGGWVPPPGARCPFGPRTGWLVIVLLLGPIGWLLYMRAQSRRSTIRPSV
jgi:hypothetical protein